MYIYIYIYKTRFRFVLQGARRHTFGPVEKHVDQLWKSWSCKKQVASGISLPGPGSMGSLQVWLQPALPAPRLIVVVVAEQRGRRGPFGVVKNALRATHSIRVQRLWSRVGIYLTVGSHVTWSRKPVAGAKSQAGSQTAKSSNNIFPHRGKPESSRALLYIATNV